MCLIIASNGDHKPSNDVLKDAENRNSDGAGFAWVSSGQIQWRKGLDVEQVIKAVEKATGPFVAHFRIGTHGPKIPELTHPFPITSRASPSLTGRSPRVLFQNGTYGKWEEELKSALLGSGFKCPAPPWSDARALAVITFIMGKEYLKLCGSSRFLIFDGTKKKGTIDLIGDWHEAKDGCFYSNTMSKAFPNTAYSHATGGYSRVNTTNQASCGGGSSSHFPNQTRTAADIGKTQNSAMGGSGNETSGKRTVIDYQRQLANTMDPGELWTGFDVHGKEDHSET